MTEQTATVPAAWHSRTCAIFTSAHAPRSATPAGQPAAFRPVPCDCDLPNRPTVPMVAAPAPTLVQRAADALRAAGYPVEWYNTGGGCMVLRFEHGDPRVVGTWHTREWEVMVSPHDGPFLPGDIDADPEDLTTLAAVLYRWDPYIGGHDQDVYAEREVPLVPGDHAATVAQLVVAVTDLLATHATPPTRCESCGCTSAVVATYAAVDGVTDAVCCGGDGNP